MPGWYDIIEFSDSASRSDDEAGITRSQAVLHNLIAAEVNAGISSERVILGGFSQGGAMSLLAGLTAPTKLGGIFGLSCYLLMPTKLQSLIPADNPNKETPIFMGHGDSDPLVLTKWGKATADQLNEWKFNVKFNTYPRLGHSASLEEIQDLENYVKSRIPPLGSKGA